MATWGTPAFHHAMSYNIMAKCTPTPVAIALNAVVVRLPCERGNRVGKGIDIDNYSDCVIHSILIVKASNASGASCTAGEALAHLSEKNSRSEAVQLGAPAPRCQH